MSIIVTGYHGTSLAAWTSISRGGPGSFWLSRSADDWLGDGIYFWQDAPIHATQWAARRYGTQAVVIAAQLDLNDCLDLFDHPTKQQLINAFTIMPQAMHLRSLAPPTQTPPDHSLDNDVIEFEVKQMAKLGQRVRCVRSPFIDGNALYPNSAFHDDSYIQIAIRDPLLIMNIWKYM